MHTTKHFFRSFLGINFDATIYTSGGVTFTVEVVNIDTGEKVKTTFKGLNAKERAVSFAETEISK